MTGGLVKALAVIIVYLVIATGISAMALQDDTYEGYIPDAGLTPLVEELNFTEAVNITQLPLTIVSGEWVLDSGSLVSVAVPAEFTIESSDFKEPSINYVFEGVSDSVGVYIIASRGITLVYPVYYYELDVAQDVITIWHERLIKFKLPYFGEEKLIIEREALKSFGYDFTSTSFNVTTTLSEPSSEDGARTTTLTIDGDLLSTFSFNHELMLDSVPLGVITEEEGVRVSFINSIETYVEQHNLRDIVPLMLRLLVYNPPQLGLPALVHFIAFTLPFILLLALAGLFVGGISPL